MKSKQMMFFAVINDLEQIVRDFETTVGVKYFKTGLFDAQDATTYNSIFDTNNLGVTFYGDWNKIDNYLVMKKTIPLKIRDVPQRTGEMKFAVDQMDNPKSIEMKLGGIYKENIIVAGRIATISEDADSMELYKLFTTKIKKQFKKIGTFYVGGKAEEKLKIGWRLVTNEKSPKEYDLAI